MFTLNTTSYAFSHAPIRLISKHDVTISTINWIDANKATELKMETL